MTERPRRYFASHYILLRFLGLGWWHHPDEDNTNNFPRTYLYYSIFTQIFWVSGFIILESIEPFLGDKDRFMFSISFVITHDLTMIKIYIFITKNREFQSIVRTIEIDLCQFYQNHDRNRKTIKIIRIITFVFVFFGWMTILIGNANGIYQDFQWKAKMAQLNDSSLRVPRTLPQPVYIPWGYESNTSFIFTVILESIGLLWTGHIILTTDTFIASLIFHMSNQFITLQEAMETAYDRTMSQLAGILPHEIEHFGEPCNDELLMQDNFDDDEIIIRTFYTEEQIEMALTKTLKQCFRQHQMLIDCVTTFATTYTYGFMTQLISSLSAICVIMVQVSQDASSLKSAKLFTSLAFFMCMIVQLALQCFTGNELTIQAGKVADSVIKSKWELMSPRQGRLLVLMMVRAQKPLQLSAAGFATMDNFCFVAIMKAAYSYYAVLSQKSK